MSRWTDSFKQHKFQIILQDFSNLLSSHKLTKEADINTVNEYSRLRKVIKYIQSVNSSIDPDLISPQIMNEMQGNLQGAYNEFNAFVSNQNSGHIVNANNNIDNVLSVISRAFVYYKKPSGNVLSDIVKTYSDTIGEHQNSYKNHIDTEVQKIKEKSEEIEAGLDEVEGSAEALKEDLKATQLQVQTQLAEFNTQFQNSQAANLQKSDDAINISNRKSEEQRNGNQKKFDDLVNKTQIRIDESVKKFQAQVDDQFKDLSIKAGTILNILGKLQDDAEKVFGVVQNTAQAGAHKIYADTERRTANWYRYGAIFLMLSSVAVLIIPELLKFINIENYVVEWTKILDRLPISLILFAPAFYLARESNKHRQNEFQNRRRELTLRTIDPYLALLKTDTQRDELKGQIAKSIFSDDARVSVEAGDMTTHLVSLLDNISKFINRRGS